MSAQGGGFLMGFKSGLSWYNPGKPLFFSFLFKQNSQKALHSDFISSKYTRAMSFQKLVCLLISIREISILLTFGKFGQISIL
jgi:hypothetical protein